MFELITPVSYWILTILWLVILGLYLGKLRQSKVAGGAVAVLLTILAIDAFRTVFESVYFGLYFNSLFGLLPKGIHDVLSQPELIIIPKLINVVAGLLVLFLLIHRWVPREIREREEWIQGLQEAKLLAEERREEAEQQFLKFEAMFNAISDGIVMTDTDRRIIAVNRGMKQTFGYTFDDLSGKNTSVLYESDDEFERQGRIRFNLTAEEKTKPYEVSYRRRDGQTFIGETIGTAIKGTAGNTLGYFGVIRDVTERKQAEEALEESEREYRNILNNMVDTFYRTDLEGFTTVVSPSVRELLGYEPEELIGTKMAERYVDPHGREKFLVKLAEANGRVIGHESQLRKKDGSVIWVQTNSQYYYDRDGQVAGVEGIARDITAYKEAGEALRRSQKMEAVGQLTGGVAHDFNNLLGVMIGNTELLQNRIGDDEKAHRNVDAILRAANRGASLTKRLLAFSRQQTLAPQPTAINGMVAGLEDMLQRTLGETIELQTNLGPGACEALVDPHQLEDALLNLAINARDAMPDGGVLSIEIADVTVDEAYAAEHEGVMPGDYVRVAVTDTGTGMAPEILEKVYEPFFTTKGVGEGSGLGLSMVYGFVKQSNGYIEIESEVGHGTTIELYLPQSQEGVIQKDDTDETPEFALGSERILVIEDDEDLRDIPVSILRGHGYEVVEARDGKTAITCLQDGPPFELIFTDMVLPGGMNGKEIAVEAKRIQPGIKVLFTSGYAEGSIAHNGKLDPDVMLLGKPYRRRELLKKVQETIHGGDD